MKIGILQTGHSPEGLVGDFGDYGEMFVHLLGGQDFEFEIFSVVDGILPKNVIEADGWLITGSKFGAYEDLPWIPLLEDFLRQAYASGIPIVGICFGHQILAKALGGKVEKYQGGWSVGATDYSLRDSDQTITLNAWHQDQVVKRPDGAEVLASSPFCENAVLIYDEKALTIQAHPEFGTDFVKGLIEKRGRGLVPDPLLDSALSKTNAAISSDWSTQLMVRFFKQPRV